MPKSDKPNPGPSVRPPIASGSLPAVDTGTEPTPRTPADIPGLGPIRVRALQKAGLDSLNVLRTAPMETLLAVPGLSEIKARQIQTFLARFPADAFLNPLPLPEPKPEEAANPMLVQWSAPGAQQETVSPLLAETIRTLGRTIALLLSDHAADFRHRLMRGIERFAQQTEGLTTETASLTTKDREKVMRRLRRVSEVFDEARGQETFDRKAQLRLAETLDETSDWLAALLSQGEPHRSKPTKASHD